MGSEINLYVAIGGQSVTARIKSDVEPEVGKPRVLDVNMLNAHFFDVDTQQTIV
jgi:hypothetical protein